MPFQPVPQVAQFNVRARLNGETVENVFHLVDAANAIWSAAALSAYAQQIGTLWRDNVMTFLSEDYQLLEVEARDLSIDGGFTGAWQPGTITIGGVDNGSLPNNVAMCFTKRTGRAGRSFRGRTYIAGLPEAVVTGNTVADPTIVGLLNGLRAAVLQPGTSSIQAVVVSRVNGNVTRPQGIWTIIQDFGFFDGTVDSQRRRLPGRGA